MRVYKWITLLLFLTVKSLVAQHQPEFSTAGFFQVKNSPREVFSMNYAWRVHKGDIENAFQINFDDSDWELVSLPNGIEKQPVESSGGTNYQGVVWYRKHFDLDKKVASKEKFLYFEGIMGKSKIYINGELVKEHFGGFLPIVIDATKYLKEGKNLIAVCADNSNDPIYPPGKPQEVLDFTYSGGIYRDCWLITHGDVFVTDANYEDIPAGGGVFVSYDNISEKEATIRIKTHIRNQSDKNFKGVLEYELLDKNNKLVKKVKENISIPFKNATTNEVSYTLKQPKLWSPEHPYLYNLVVNIKNSRGQLVDALRKRIGVRSFEFKAADGFWLNGKPYREPLIGANRHQDFAVLGNALPNKLHWRDAKKLRDLGLKVIRNAHYPQDPAFMDACDELGLLVIVNTPGWQFWNKEPIFEQRVYKDIRNMVRRDRNHPSVWLWEPILNETWYPENFAKQAYETVNEEYPYPYCYSACDLHAKGSEYFPVLFTHPEKGNAEKVELQKTYDKTKTYYTREWGDNVDDWSSHNSPSRVARRWGEQPMMIQAIHYMKPPYDYTSYDKFFRQKPQHVGGSLWHSFDHQRGYHPDPFYGGFMDNFRQPKTSYYAFKSQRSPKVQKEEIFETGPVLYIANEMTPFSSEDVTVFTNCDEVRLTFNKDGETKILKRKRSEVGLPYPMMVFENSYNFMKDKKLARQKKYEDAYLLAEGYIDGKKVITQKIAPARRPTKLLLWLDDEKTSLEANGSDVVTVIAAIADDNGNIKRLNNSYVRFYVEGEGELVADRKTETNPIVLRWGTAPILLRSTRTPGKIKIKAEVLFSGSQRPKGAELEIESKPTSQSLIYDASEAQKLEQKIKYIQKKNAIQEEDADKYDSEELKRKLKEVEKQQDDFGEVD